MKELSDKTNTVDDKIKKIEYKLEELIENISKNQSTKDLIPTFQIIEEYYISLEDKEKQILKKYNKEIYKLCEHIKNKEYTNITNKILINISEKIIEEIKNNPEKNGKFLAWKLNRDLYINQEENINKIDYTKEEEEEDLYRLKNIIDFLDFSTKENKKDIIGGFNIFLTNILVKNGKETKTLSETVPSVIAEVKNHIITFFENFNENDFLKLKEELKDKTEKEFLDIILKKINNSEMIIPNKSSIKNEKYIKPQPVFKQTRNGKWYYSMSSSGKLDLYASYNKKIITTSTTTNDENGFEGSQLLIHPMKEHLMTKEAKQILTKEIKLNDNIKSISDLEEWKEFDKDSIFYGLSLKRTEKGELNIKISNIDILKGENKQFWRDILKEKEEEKLLFNQIEKMDTLFIINKIILESGRFRKKKDNEEKEKRLKEYRDKIITIGNMNNIETIKKFVLGKELQDNKLTEKECIEILGNHTFDFQSLTLIKLNKEENELLIEMWLKKEFLFYEKFVSEETDIVKTMFKNIKVRNPLIKIDLEKIYQNNKSENFIKLIIKILNEEKFDNSLSEGVEKITIIEKIIEKFEKTNNKLENITPIFMKSIFTQNKQKIILSLIIEYINKLRETNKEEFQKIYKNKDFIKNLNNVFIEVSPSISKLKKQLLFVDNIEKETKIEEEKSKLINYIAKLLQTGDINPTKMGEILKEITSIKEIAEIKELKRKHKEILKIKKEKQILKK